MVTMNGFEKSGYYNRDLLVRISLIFPKAWINSLDWSILEFFFRHWISGFAILAKLCINFVLYPAIPRKLLISFWVLGKGRFWMTWILSGFGSIPLLVILCPRNKVFFGGTHICLLEFSVL